VNDPTTLKLSGHTVSLMHGDTLCTDDISYQTYRKQVRDPSFQQMFLSKSIEERLAIARQIREQSKKNYQQRTDDRIMDVNQQAVEDEFKALNCKLLIHGHTHRPAIHRNKEQGHYRIVLGDWYAQESYLKYEDGVLELKSKGEKETLNLNEI
jgi:UDP-2,3-diacylglucosamine hydrolase